MADSDIVVFQGTSTVNGRDTVTDFTIGVGGEVIDIDTDLAGLRGDGTVAQRATNGDALNANADLGIFSINIADEDAAEAFIGTLLGGADGDFFYLLGSTDADTAAAVTTLYSVAFVNIAGPVVIQASAMVTFNAFELDNLTADNLNDYAAIV